MPLIGLSTIVVRRNRHEAGLQIRIIDVLTAANVASHLEEIYRCHTSTIQQPTGAGHEFPEAPAGRVVTHRQLTAVTNANVQMVL